MVVQKQTVESEIQFQNREMLKVLLHAFHGQEFLSDGLTSHGLGSFRDLPSEPFRGIDLPEPSCIPVTGRAHGHAGMKVAEEEFFIWLDSIAMTLEKPVVEGFIDHVTAKCTVHGKPESAKRSLFPCGSAALRSQLYASSRSQLQLLSHLNVRVRNSIERFQPFHGHPCDIGDPGQGVSRLHHVKSLC